ncbi:phospholipase D/nuclease [Teratosphaeria destructans]|uniref:Phospholipase D/nuclease n=1 Tax=Teratosphaeria destructans TaxID=418781 RepID=A0A9W7SWC7_9PEZI|nr:phospholipase D/nuclease [Teratosphaeria destructans]
MPGSDLAADICTGFRERLEDPAVQSLMQRDQPNFWNNNIRSLFNKSVVVEYGFGTGHTIFESMIAPAMSGAQGEIILVTCFWAPSESLNEIKTALRMISSARDHQLPAIRVRICFSSSSVLQKLMHTSSLRGRTYAQTTAWKLLGLKALPGIDLRVKSMFVRPISVMHTKFVIIDRSTVFLPSCNVSHENWLEVCVRLSGPIVSLFMNFWLDFWVDAGDEACYLANASVPPNFEIGYPRMTNMICTQHCQHSLYTAFLPSPHHSDVKTLWCARQAPQTPLNMYLLELFGNAKRSIFIQTPNITSRPVLDELERALWRNLDVRIITNDRLMTNEQIVTARTTTPKCVRELIKNHRKALRSMADDPERSYGSLRISYYRSTTHSRKQSEERGLVDPVKSHMKVTIVDDQIVVLGSGNMDRASWFTSQELGVAFDSDEFAGTIRQVIEHEIMGDRLVDVYNGRPTVNSAQE